MAGAILKMLVIPLRLVGLVGQYYNQGAVAAAAIVPLSTRHLYYNNHPKAFPHAVHISTFGETLTSSLVFHIVILKTLFGDDAQYM